MQLGTDAPGARLAHYTALARSMATHHMEHAIKDILVTLRGLRDRPLTDPYIAKLYAELDAYTVEVTKRRRRTK